jgi:hypothetical protein
MLSFRLFVDAADLGALNLYGSAAGAFTTDSQIVGALFAQHAAVVLAGSTRDDQLSDAIATRDVIGQAKGILMHRNRITGQQAFTLLSTPPNTPRSSLWTSPAGGSRCTSRRCPNHPIHSGDIGLPVTRRLLTRLGCSPSGVSMTW